MIGTSSEKTIMNTTVNEVQNIANDLAAALTANSSTASFVLDDLRVEYEIGARNELKVLIVGDREYPLLTPLHAASAALAVHEGFIAARAILVRQARDTALKLAADEKVEALGKTQRALAVLAALPFVNPQTQFFQPQ